MSTSIKNRKIYNSLIAKGVGAVLTRGGVVYTYQLEKLIDSGRPFQKMIVKHSPTLYDIAKHSLENIVRIEHNEHDDNGLSVVLDDKQSDIIHVKSIEDYDMIITIALVYKDSVGDQLLRSSVKRCLITSMDRLRIAVGTEKADKFYLEFAEGLNIGV